MLILCCLLLLSVGGVSAAAASVASTVTINLDSAGDTAIPESSLGCHYSPLDHQLYYVYSQMLYDESFEQSLGGTEKEGPGDTVSLGWANLSHADGAGRIVWSSDPAEAFNGNASVVLETAPHATSSTATNTTPSAPSSTAGRIGVANRGLYHQGFALEGGKQYQGYLAVKSDTPALVTVALEDWGGNPSQPPPLTAPAATPPAPAGTPATLGTPAQPATPPPVNHTVAQTTVQHVGDGKWTVLPFTLTPSRATACTPFPYGAPPLDCGIPRSQSKFPPSESGECVVCGGTLTISIATPSTATTTAPGRSNRHNVTGDGGASGNAAAVRVSIDQVFLEPGEWGLYKGLHLHRTPVEWIQRMGQWSKPPLATENLLENTDGIL